MIDVTYCLSPHNPHFALTEARPFLPTSRQGHKVDYTIDFMIFFEKDIGKKVMDSRLPQMYEHAD